MLLNNIENAAVLREVLLKNQPWQLQTSRDLRALKHMIIRWTRGQN